MAIKKLYDKEEKSSIVNTRNFKINWGVKAQEKVFQVDQTRSLSSDS